MFKPVDLFDLTQTAHAALFADCEDAWDALKKLKGYIDAYVKLKEHSQSNGRKLNGPDTVKQHVLEALRAKKRSSLVSISENVFIGEGTVIEDGAMIKGPAIIGSHCEIRHNAYIREHVIIGDHCVIGNACEFKHSWLFNYSNVPHFSYVGDSILGHKAHLGAGVKISNVKLMPGNVMVEKNGAPFDTGLRKFGALLGDHTDIGCNSVLNPGSIIGRGSVIYPNTNWRGVLPPDRIVKNKAGQEVTARSSRAKP